jgi:hypothetical protein
VFETGIIVRNLPATGVTISTAAVDDAQLEGLPLWSTSAHDSLLFGGLTPKT